MGRFTSVQGFADNNSNNRTITYDQAKGGSTNSNSESDNKKLVTEKVVNPYGSTSGAGSGEFHVYRHARARELARWNALDAEAKEQEAEQKFRASLQEDQTSRETKAEKNRRKRQREKEAKRRKKHLKAAGIDVQRYSPSTRDEEEEFTYIPKEQQQQQEKEKEEENNTKPAAAEPKSEISFANDGSFLEMMKRKLEEEQKSAAKEKQDDTIDETEKGDEKAKDNTVEEEESDEEGPALPQPKK
mmetsp:Transcript_5994/g.14525  ORF Transcript_5994/g.14525 Transcript_5994/m.14525 type:complete len:244 (+) Transcript_5994:102-833(+)